MSKSQFRVTESNELLDAFISNTPFGVAVIDLEGRIKKANKLAVQYLSLKVEAEDLSNSNFLSLVHDIPDLFDVLQKSLKDGRKPFTIDSLIIDETFLTISGQVILDGFIVTIEDITKQKEMEANSIQAILEGQENERRRIGREIHDGIGPLLSYMKLSLDSFIDELHGKEASISTDILNNISQTIDSITTDLRLLSHRLVPRLLDEFGLVPAFENMVYRLNESKKSNIKLYTNIDKETKIDSDIELSLFRCGQELLSNAVKYAHAPNILVQIILHKESLVLMVEDDGVGFDMEDLPLENYGIGLTNIDTRVRMLNGEFNLDSASGKGTVASIEIPLI